MHFVVPSAVIWPFHQQRLALTYKKPQLPLFNTALQSQRLPAATVGVWWVSERPQSELVQGGGGEACGRLRGGQDAEPEACGCSTTSSARGCAASTSPTRASPSPTWRRAWVRTHSPLPCHYPLASPQVSCWSVLDTNSRTTLARQPTVCPFEAVGASLGVSQSHCYTYD